MLFLSNYIQRYFVAVLLFSLNGCVIPNPNYHEDAGESGTGDTADTDADRDTDSDTDSDGDTDTDSDSDTDTDGDTDTDSDVDTDMDSDTDTDSDSDTDMDGDTDTHSDGDTDMDSDTDTDSDNDTDIDSDTDTDSNSDTDADNDTDTDTDDHIDTDSVGDSDSESSSGSDPATCDDDSSCDSGCNDGDVECVDGKIRTCNGGTHVWNPPIPCSGDGNECTDELCLVDECVSILKDDTCLIGKQCVSHDAGDPDNECRYCDAEANNRGWTDRPNYFSCNDDMWCNGDDTCDGKGSCNSHEYSGGNRCMAESNCSFSICHEEEDYCEYSLECECQTEGNWYDADTGLCWQKSPSGINVTWQEALDLCTSGWRLPTIDELISLIRGCRNGVETNDLSLSLCRMQPNDCAEIEYCSTFGNCDMCSYLEGPDLDDDNCYWIPELNGECSAYWSSTSSSNNTNNAWGVFFAFGDLLGDPKTSSDGKYSRCVRSE